MKNEIDLVKIKNAAIQLSQKTEKERDMFLQHLLETLNQNKTVILEANKKDIEKARKNKLSEAFVQRLFLDEKGFKNLYTKLNDLIKLKSNIGSVIEEKKLESGIVIRKVSVPIGVILVIFESRPEVTIDVAALCIKSGNIAILKGGSEAINTNQALYQCIQEALLKSDLSKYLVILIKEKTIVNSLLKENNYIDLVIARGGYNLVKIVQDKSKIPVLAHSAGGARIYVDKSADLKEAEKILINAKVNKPSVCNSLDTVLVHKYIASKFIPLITNKLKSYGVEVIKNNWDQEFLGLQVNIKIVENVTDAVKFINKYTKKHSEGIIATDKKVINEFVNGIDTAAIFINCSTRFHDGYEFGMGAEMGIATGKLHARGPVGLKELATYKWEVYGNGQIRE